MDLAVYHAAAAVPAAEPVAAICIFGVFRSAAEARARAAELAAAGDDHGVDAFIVEVTGRWLPVVTPSPGTAAEEETIAATENEAPSAGRFGSVCDVRKPATGVACPHNPSPHLPSKRPADPPAKALETQRQKLESLLTVTATETAAGTPTELEVYSALRERLALLRAFQRKLARLADEADEKCAAAARVARAVQNNHPDYVERYLANYQRALRESGIPPERVGFIHHLQETLAE